MHKLPPNNMDAEQGLIGCLLVENKNFDVISDITTEDHFFMPVHQRIFRTIADHVNANKMASFITLKNVFEGDPDLEEVGGSDYLVEIASSVVNPYGAKDYAKVLRTLYERREVVNIAKTLLERADNYSCQDDDILSEAEHMITAVSQKTESTSCTGQEAINRALSWMQQVQSGKIQPMSSGYKCLDDKVGGFFPAGLYIIAGRPGMGKTALMLNLADNISNLIPAVVVSLEMRAEELGMRLIAAQTGISVSEQRAPNSLTQEQWQAMRKVSHEGKSLYIEDRSSVNLSALKSMARRYKRIHGNFVLMIDYLGLLEMDKKIQSKVYQVEEITKTLKQIAKELAIPVVLLCQLNRGVESRDDKRPMLSDLRDSGAIEQDADVVMFPYRKEYYMERERPEKKSNEGEGKYNARLADYEKELSDCRGRAEIIIAKNRQGTLGIAHLNFIGQKQRFTEKG